ncbi:[Pyruvate dehydrogenase (acetyl-transferring)] kinase isozyme 2 [Schistosoma japonicum]|uniref:Protein-serine/threonine kinase n=2 Tax=Schistosoma japonicum TaxID=6182 RepID=A0A4Z2DNH9_SCHJA|nr:[Pyruvate dehydrogenase (acetyl-transferring)] kinase isozyme 2 [Schistosoma japonicum]
MRLSQAVLILSGKYGEHFVRFGGYSPTPLSLKKLIAFGKVGSIQKSASFLADELPVRLANILQEIHLLPERLVRTPSASLVRRWYEQSFCELMDFEKITWDEKSLNQFNELLASIRSRHTTVVETMAQGVMEMQERHKTDIITNNQVQYFLDRFYMMRISIRMLLSQHLLMFGSELNKHRRYVGSIDPDCNVREILDDAYEDAKFLCEHYYLTAPQIKVQVHGGENGKIEFVYVPSHLYHILFELLKNAMRAVVEQHSKADHLPPIQVLIATGQENVTIKISDLGGGIPRSEIDLVFNYTYTTARHAKRCGESSVSSLESGSPGQETNAPMAGYGYGLPLSRLYAKYFNGDLILSSVEGYGTDAIVYLKSNAAEADELLPVFNRTSAKQYGSVSIPVADWSNPNITTGWRRN